MPQFPPFRTIGELCTPNWPWQIRIDHGSEGFFISQVLDHTRWSVVFSTEAVEAAGGPTETDADGYVTCVVNEPQIARTARRMLHLCEEATANNKTTH